MSEMYFDLEKIIILDLHHVISFYSLIKISIRNLNMTFFSVKRFNARQVALVDCYRPKNGLGNRFSNWSSWKGGPIIVCEGTSF